MCHYNHESHLSCTYLSNKYYYVLYIWVSKLLIIESAIHSKHYLPKTCYDTSWVLYCGASYSPRGPARASMVTWESSLCCSRTWPSYRWLPIDTNWESVSNEFIQLAPPLAIPAQYSSSVNHSLLIYRLSNINQHMPISVAEFSFSTTSWLEYL